VVGTLSGFRYPGESDVVISTAESFGIDPRFLAALREAENGGPGREYGVLSVPAPTYDDQVTIAARTIRNNLDRYRTATGDDPVGWDGRYTEHFILWFSARYAPVGASNDPTGLNSYHARNLSNSYAGVEVV